MKLDTVAKYSRTLVIGSVYLNLSKYRFTLLFDFKISKIMKARECWCLKKNFNRTKIRQNQQNV